MKLILAALLSLSAQAFACDLNFPLAGVCGTVRWNQGPVLRTESTLEIEFSPAVDPATVKVDAWMPAHNHGTRPVTITALPNGNVQITKLYFVMPGEWMLRVRIPIAYGEEGNLVELAELPVVL